MRLYLTGLKKTEGNGTFEDEVVLEGADDLGHRLVGFFHKNYVFHGALEVEVSENDLVKAILNYRSINVIPCGGGFIGRGREISVNRDSLCYRTGSSENPLGVIKLTEEDLRRK
ncbi:hypothetical protein A3K73_02055 [Candidatus Pacearchaeota archaeon RBG_13_36_9]|nr:MAG: hypothetical protein A3K73_02055 [Candidatus Pacearchaeota archaeon RBG_13_36_9]